MAGQLFTSTELDKYGRQLLLDDTVVDVHYYTTIGESWDKSGSSNQSWSRENFLPNDTFDTKSILSDRWVTIDSTDLAQSTINQSSGALNFGVEKDEGVVALSSDSKWRFQGDFDARIYIDWDSYYNEYRSITHTFLKVGYDIENAVRIAFTFDGTGFVFSSEKTVDRDLKFFDWKDNGTLFSLSNIAAAKQYQYLKVTRESGVIKTYISTGAVDTQIGSDVSESVFSSALFLEFGVEAKEFNTTRTSFTKLFAEGELTPATEFFSTVRGRKQKFPDNSIIAVDAKSISIIDEDAASLWMRINFNEGGPVPDSTARVFACNGSLYCTTSDGLVVFDFHQDKILKYKDSTIFVADEKITLRNSKVTFRALTSNAGNIQDNNIHSVSCRHLYGEDFIAFTTDAGVVVKRALASGVAYSGQGPLPSAGVAITEGGALYWSGYDSANNLGELSFFSDVTTFTPETTVEFSRTGFYSPDTVLDIFGQKITTFDALTVQGVDLVAVGTTEGLTFLSFSPAAINTGAFSYGVEGGSINPVIDPSFENYLGIDWKVLYTGFHARFFATRTTSFFTDQDTSVKLKFNNPPNDGFLVKDWSGGVYQDVDFTGVDTLYFDIKLDIPTSGGSFNTNEWNFEVVVGDTVLKTYKDTDGPFVKSNDSVDVTGFAGTNRLTFRLVIVFDTASIAIDQKAVFIDNIRTKIGEPDFRVLPVGDASIKEVLLQYDNDHKIYFSTAGGYGALDVDDNSLDYFIPISNFIADSSVVSSDFSRVTDEN